MNAADASPSPPPQPPLNRPPGGGGFVPPPPAAQKPPQYPVFIPSTGKHLPRYRHRRRRSCCCCCCLWSLAIFILLLAIFALVAAGVQLWLRPSVPEIAMQRVLATKFDVIADNKLSSVLDIYLAVRNCNDAMEVKYSDVVTRASYTYGMGTTELGTSSSPGFEQPERNSTVVKLRWATASGGVVDGYTVKKMAAEYKQKQLELDIEVEMKIVAVFKDVSFVTLPVTVVCAGIRVDAADDPRRCKIYLDGRILLNQQ